MRLRRCLLFAAAPLLGASVVVLPAVAGGTETPPSITAVNEAGGKHKWSPDAATIGENGEIEVSNPSGSVPHGVEWISGPNGAPEPSCEAGVPVGTSPAASGTNWHGKCKFTKPGTYVFYCTVHGPEMTGTVTVNANGTATMTMSTPTQTSPTGTSPTETSPGSSTSTGGTSGGSSLTPPTSLLAASALSSLKLAGTQHGLSVHGTVTVPAAAAGGHLEVQLLATRAALASAGHSAPVQVGRLVRSSLHVGALSFAVPLDSRARHALRASRRLALRVKVVLVSPHGGSVTSTHAVVLRS